MRLFNYLHPIFLILTLVSSLEATHLAIVKEEFIFQDPPFAYCHASTLAETHSGKLLCAYFAGTEEGKKDVAIWLSSMKQDQWHAPQKIAFAQNTPCWNPVLFTMPSKEVLLFYKAGPNPLEWSGIIKRSFDEGEHWSKEEDLPAGVLGPIKNKPLLLENGDLLCGTSIESWRRWGCYVDITKDGYNWSKSSPINVNSQLFGIIQPTLFLTKDNSVRLLTRSYQIGFICSAESFDQGRTWTEAKETDLPNPNSGIDCVKIQDGRVLLVYNHSQQNRFPLNIAISRDDGKTWKMALSLEEIPGEYSYPSIIQTNDGKVHISYTWNRKNIKHVVIDPNKL